MRTDAGVVRARVAVVGTSAYPSPVRALGRYVAPVYDYVFVSERLTPAQHASIGWQRRQAIDDPGNRFHYYRLTPDDRILWGGWDAVHRYGGPVASHLDDHDPTFATLSQHFFTTFPQLDGLRFTHRWGG
ncbi:MAG: FAD-dependent oxidoreductase, partial [Dehalococcoidia bacterium]